MSLADRYFEDAVRAFEAGDYDLAAETFSKAIEFAPEDMILPFAYCQALFADVRERLAQETAGEPDDLSLADRFFEDAVEAFDAGDYDSAAEMFARAAELAPDDMILPFAFCQALVAGEKYMEAAEVLRTALANVTPEKEGVFYPLGLYAEEDTLFEQLDRLAKRAALYSFDGDLQLLLGYQLLGIGEIDAAVEPLRLAGQDLQNASAAAVLLDLLEKIRTQNADDTD